MASGKNEEELATNFITVLDNWYNTDPDSFANWFKQVKPSLIAQVKDSSKKDLT